jgi:hypothetical protein
MTPNLTQMKLEEVGVGVGVTVMISHTLGHGTPGLQLSES